MCGALVLRGVAGRVSPGGDSLSFASPKESKQRKGDPGVCVPTLRFGQPAVRASGGVRANSLHCVALKQCAALIRLKLCSSAQPQGVGADSQTAEQPDTEVTGFAWVLSLVSDPDSPVLAGPVLCPKSGIRTAHCLSAASLGGPPLFGHITGCPKRSAGTRTRGRLSFAYFSLAKQRKVSSRRATPGQQLQEKPTTLRIQ